MMSKSKPTLSFLLTSLVLSWAATKGHGIDVQPTFRSVGGKLDVTLEIGPVVYSNNETGLKQYLVGYNGTVGGPTMYVKPGDQLSVTLINSLPKEPCNTYVPELFNQYHAVDITNLHFHGLHISEASHPDGKVIRQGEAFTYSFKIPEYHMGGTHWYHPHFPGSSSLQAGGGALGMLIVEDMDDDIPGEILNLPDLNFRVQFINMTYLQADYATGTDGSYVPLCQQFCLPVELRPNCTEFFFENGPLEGEYNTTIAPDGLEYETTLVNGVERPTLDIVKDQWYRARILYVPTRFRTLEPAFPGCTVKLLAKDGLYMLETPRDAETGFMTAGSRVDFLIRCSEVGNFEFRSLSEARSSEAWIASQKRPSIGRVLAYLNVQDASGSVNNHSNPDEIRVFKPPRPCYAADMMDVEPDSSTYLVLSGLVPVPPQADPLPIDRQPCCTNRSNTSYYDVNGLGPYDPMHRGETGVEGREFDFTLETGSIWEVDFYTAQIHPPHYHVNVFQVVELPEIGAHKDFFKEGDFHDILQLTIPETDYYGKAKARFSIAYIPGDMLGHCHFYRHTDRGMGYRGQIVGVEGAVSPKLEGTCYNDLTSRGAYEYVGEETSSARTIDGETSSAPANYGLIGLMIPVIGFGIGLIDFW